MPASANIPPALNEHATHRVHTPTVIARADHPVSRALVVPAALKVLYRLKDAGYQAFLVGGCVRDILLGIEPKDFDVATDARPEDVRRLFRSCRLIGRRFRLAHVRFGDEIIEVATFRATHEPGEPEDLDDELDDREGEVGPTVLPEELELDEPLPAAATAPSGDSAQRVQDDRGRLLRDNLYGSIDQDVWRRDFTCNALYYNIEDFSIWDYVGGVADVRARCLRLIGDPETRYREDPVRMLRAVRFQAKLGFSLDPDTEAPIARLAGLLDGIPAARLFDEAQKLFLAGFACRSFELLVDHGLLDHLFPSLAAHLAHEPTGMTRRLIERGLANTDRRVQQGRPVTPTFLFAVLLFGPISDAAQRRFDAGKPATLAIAEACDEVIAAQVHRIGLPKRFSVPLRELLALQPRFQRRDGRKALNLLNHPRFRAAYDFLLLRAEAGAEDVAVARWWTAVQDMPAEDRLAQVERPRAPGEAQPGGAPRRRRRRRRPAAPPA